MASEEMRKKWGTIFMGEREASVEQLNAMQEPLRKEKRQKEQAEDYMERVRQKAADRARVILGEAYTERQKVLEEAKKEALEQKRLAEQDCAKLKAEGEAVHKQAQAELERAEAERREAEKLRAAAHDEGFKSGMDQADAELHEFRAELGQSLATVLHALERQRGNIMTEWREDIAELVRCATQAATGYILQKEHQTILRSLVFQALDLLENRSVVSIKVNPADEAAVSDMFRAARERFPELKQWIVNGDQQIESGGLVAESGSGRADLKRENFRDMVESILSHLSLPESAEDIKNAHAVRDIVEQEVAHIASLTPEMDFSPPEEEQIEDAAPEADVLSNEYLAEEKGVPKVPEDEAQPIDTQIVEPAGIDEVEQPEAEPDIAPVLSQEEPELAQDPSIEELEEELFPLEGEGQAEASMPDKVDAKTLPPEKEQAPTTAADPKTLAEGGFL